MNKEVIKSYFVFSKKERYAAIILLVVIGIASIVPYVFTAKHPIVQRDSLFEQEAALLFNDKDSNYKYRSSEYHAYNDYSDKSSASTSLIEANLFKFNPNTLDEAGWRKLGLPERNIRTIQNYVTKGGRFKHPEDIRKIWGLSPIIANQLIPFIDIPQEQRFNNAYPGSSYAGNQRFEKTMIQPFDINTASIDQFRPIKNFDFGMAYRILRFRDKLGGFVSIDQIKETNGLNDTLFSMLEPWLQKRLSAVNKININTASEAELNNHPYINAALAKAIVFYRNKNGLYQYPGDLKRIIFLKDDVLQKLLPYITVQN